MTVALLMAAGASNKPLEVGKRPWGCSYADQHRRSTSVDQHREPMLLDGGRLTGAVPHRFLEQRRRPAVEDDSVKPFLDNALALCLWKRYPAGGQSSSSSNVEEHTAFIRPDEPNAPATRL